MATLTRSKAVAVFRRHRWQCQMRECLRPEGRDIEPGLLPDDDWSATVDHIVPLALGGTNAFRNLRAAHRACNEHAARHLKNRVIVRVPGSEAFVTETAGPVCHAWSVTQQSGPVCCHGSCWDIMEGRARTAEMRLARWRVYGVRRPPGTRGRGAA